MRTADRIPTLIAGVIAVSVVVLYSAGLVSAADIIGSFSRIEGSVDLMRGGVLPALSAKIGDPVQVGDFIRTKSNARAEVTFKDGNILKIAQRSRIDVAEYRAAGGGDSRKFNLPRGKVQAVVTKGASGENSGSRFEIHTPNAVAGVRGTEFFVFHDRNVTGILVKEGSVYAFNPKTPQNVVTVPAGTVTTVSEKSAPQPPRPATEVETKSAEKDTTAQQKSEGKSENKSGGDQGTSDTASAQTPQAQTPSTEPAGSTTTAGTDSSTESTAAATATAPATEAAADAAAPPAAVTETTAQPAAPASASTVEATSSVAPQTGVPTVPLTMDSTFQAPVTAPSTTMLADPVAAPPPSVTVIVPVTETAPEETLDTAAPDLSIVSSPASMTNVTSASFDLSSTETGVAYSISLDGGAPQPYVPGTSLTSLADGPHTVEITAADASGNISPPVSFSWTVDTVAPTIGLIFPPAATSTTDTAPFTIQSSESGATMYRVDGGIWQGFTGTVPPLAEGVHRVEFQSTDPAGNSSSVAGADLFVGSRAINFDGSMSGMPGGVASLTGRLYEYADKSAGSWGFKTSGSGTPSASLAVAAGGKGSLDGTTLDGFWQITGSGATASGGSISGGLNYTYLGFDRLVNSTSGTIAGSYDASGWNFSAIGTALTGYATPLGFAAEIKVGPMHRDGSIDPNSSLLTIVNHGGMDGLLGAPSGLWSGSSVPITLLGVYQGPGSQNSYWQGDIKSHTSAASGLAGLDGGTFSGYIGGANLDSAGINSGNLAAIYAAPRVGGGFGAGLINGSFSGSLGAGFWGASGNISRLELSSSAADPSTMSPDWWTTTTTTTNPPLVTGPQLNDEYWRNAEGFMMDTSKNLTSELLDRGDVLKLTTFNPDPAFGVWQLESFGTFAATDSDLILLTNTSDTTLVNGKPIPDNIYNIVSRSGLGTDGLINGNAYGFWGDWGAGKTRLLSGVVNGSYNSGLGTFGAVTSGAWLDVNRFLVLTQAERIQAGFPGLQEYTFGLSGTNAFGSTVSLANIRTFSTATGDPLSLWATDSVSGSFSGSVPEGEQIAISDGSGQIRGSFRLEHGGTSATGNVWLAELHAQGEMSGGFRSSFNGVAAGTWNPDKTFTGTAAGITHPLTYFSSFGSTNLLKRYDGASGYQFAGALHGVFGGMSLWTATDQFTSDFEIVGLHSPATFTNQDYIFTTTLDSFDIPNGSATTADGGAYKGYLVGALANGSFYPDQLITGGIAALYAAPNGTAGILTGKFDGWIDMSGFWESQGEWYPVEVLSAPGTVSSSSWSVLSSSLPLNVAQTGSFIGAGGGSLSSVASISGNNLDRNWISSQPWGVWRLVTSGIYTGQTYNNWSYGVTVNDANYYMQGGISGDTWATVPPMPPNVSPSVGKLHGNFVGSWADMTLTVAQTGIIVGETIGTFDPNALRWQAVAAGAFMETNAFLQMASTTAGQAKLQQLNIPAFEIGSADFSGSAAVSADSVNVTMAGVKYFAPTAGGRPVIWATGNVSGTYTGNPVAVGNVNLTGSSATVSGLSPVLKMKSFSGGKWGASLASPATGTVGGHTNVMMNGVAAGGYTGTTSGSFSGTAAGGVK